MTVTEFSNEFDIAYNSIATNSAPALDLYEKSVYLTRAQLEIVNQHFNPKGNKYTDGFEGSLKRRSDLNELVKTGVSSDSLSSTLGISPDSQFYTLNKDVYMIIQEKALVGSNDSCIDGTTINVKPVTHDEYNLQINNPFKEPGSSVIWRLDFYTQDGVNKNVELISPYTIKQYNYRYIKYPTPIVLTDLSVAFPGEGLSIDNVFALRTCELSSSVHREILNRAVELATADYKPQDLAVKVQTNNRNE